MHLPLMSSCLLLKIAHFGQSPLKLQGDCRVIIFLPCFKIQLVIKFEAQVAPTRSTQVRVHVFLLLKFMNLNKYVTLTTQQNFLATLAVLQRCLCMSATFCTDASGPMRMKVSVDSSCIMTSTLEALTKIYSAIIGCIILWYIPQRSIL